MDIQIMVVRHCRIAYIYLGDLWFCVNERNRICVINRHHPAAQGQAKALNLRSLVL